MLVLTEKKGPVTIITINRPEVRNAVDRPTAEELAEALRRFEADEEARVAVPTVWKKMAMAQWGQPACGWISR